MEGDDYILNEEITGIYLGGLRMNTKSLNHDTLCTGWASKTSLQNKNSTVKHCEIVFLSVTNNDNKHITKILIRRGKGKRN